MGGRWSCEVAQCARRLAAETEMPMRSAGVLQSAGPSGGWPDFVVGQDLVHRPVAASRISVTSRRAPEPPQALVT